MILSQTMVAESDIKVRDVKRHTNEVRVSESVRAEIPQFGSVCVFKIIDLNCYYTHIFMKLQMGSN